MIDRVCKDHLGREFESMADMCKYWGVKYGVFYNRYKIKGYDLENSLTMEEPVHYVEDHLGNKFRSVDRMCRYHNVSLPTYNNRRKIGLSLEEALTKPTRGQGRRKILD